MVYKKRINALLIVSYSLCAGDTLNSDSARVLVNFHNNNSHHIVMHNNSTVTSTSQTQMPSLVPSSSPLSVPEQTLLNHVLKSCWAYKATLMMSGLAAVGCYALAHCVLLQRSINNPNNWSSWKGDVSLAELAKHSQAHLARALFNEIAQRYTHKNTNLLDPLVNFVNDTDQELQQLESMNTAYLWFSRSYIGYMVPLLTHAHERVAEKIERLKFLKRLLIAWLSEYRVEHA